MLNIIQRVVFILILNSIISTTGALTLDINFLKQYKVNIEMGIKQKYPGQSMSEIFANYLY